MTQMANFADKDWIGFLHKGQSARRTCGRRGSNNRWEIYSNEALQNKFLVVFVERRLC